MCVYKARINRQTIQIQIAFSRITLSDLLPAYSDKFSVLYRNSRGNGKIVIDCIHFSIVDDHVNIRRTAR